MSTLIMREMRVGDWQSASEKFLLLNEKFLQQAMSENDEFANFSLRHNDNDF